LALRLKELDLEIDNYEIVGGFAIYKGKQKNYVKVRESFIAKINEKINPKKETAEVIASHVGVFINLGGTSQTRTNLVKIEDKSYKLDELTSVLEIKKRVGTGFQNVDRDEPTIAAIGAAYADFTKEFLKSFPILSKIKELKELGFTNSFYCSDLSPLDYKKIYFNLLKFEDSWDTTRTNGRKPTRFTERMFFYCTLVLKMDTNFFEIIKREFYQYKADLLGQRPLQFPNY
jgi:hypothetical protein